MVILVVLVGTTVLFTLVAVAVVLVRLVRQVRWSARRQPRLLAQLPLPLFPAPAQHLQWVPGPGATAGLAPARRTQRAGRGRPVRQAVVERSYFSSILLHVCSSGTEAATQHLAHARRGTSLARRRCM